jgi:hypothetical protein
LLLLNNLICPELKVSVLSSSHTDSTSAAVVSSSLL